MALRWSDLSVSEAAEVFLQTSEMWRESGRTSESVRCLREAAVLLRIKGERQLALNKLKEALRRASTYGSIEERAMVAASIASLDLVDGGRDNSRQNALKALQDAEQSGDPYALSVVLRVWGEIHYASNDTENAVRVLEKSLALASSLDDPQLKVLTAIELSYSKLKMGDFRSALALASEAANLAVSRSDRRGEAMSRKALGKIYIALSENGRAFEELKRSERLFPQNIDRVERATLLNALAQLYERHGDQYLALEYRREAYDLFAKENHQFGIVGSTADLALSYFKKGNVVTAREFLEEGLRIERSLNNKFMRARLLEHLGAAYLLEKNPRLAIKYFENALRLFRQTNAVYQSYRVRAQYGIALGETGDFASADKELLAVLDFAKLTNNLEIQASILTIQGQFAREAGNIPASLSFFEDAVRLTEEQYKNVSNFRLQQTFLASTYDRYEMFVDALTAGSSSNPENLIKGLTVKEQSRARRLVQNLTLIGSTEIGVPEEIELMVKSGEIRANLNALADRLARTVDLQFDNKDIARLKLDMAVLENDLALIEVERAKTSKLTKANQQTTAIDPLGLQEKEIDANTVLLEFHVGANNSYLWLVEKNEISGHRLPPAAEINVFIDGIRNNISSQYLQGNGAARENTARLQELEREYRRQAHELSTLLLGAAELKLRGKRLVIVLDGKLQFFPIGSLPWPGAIDDKPIIATTDVVYAPSASVLHLLRKDRRNLPRSKRDLLVFSDPVFSTDDIRLAGFDSSTPSDSSTIGLLRSNSPLEKLQRLEASNDEATSIAGVIGGHGVSIRTGFEANRGAVLGENLADYRILHFATHGRVDEARPELSGILLSLYDREGKRNDGGFIRLQDVYGMNLNSDLVVLSACETGIGKDVRGEGLMSLTNAFLQAGSKTVVSSLWKVDDQATKELMTEFYRGMAQEGLTVSAALRQAQIKLYNDPRYKSPFYWAAFTMHGDYDRVPQISSRYSRYSTGVAILVVLALGIYLWKVGSKIGSLRL